MSAEYLGFETDTELREGPASLSINSLNGIYVGHQHRQNTELTRARRNLSTAGEIIYTSAKTSEQKGYVFVTFSG